MRQSGKTCLQNGVSCVELDVKIVKAGFRSFCSIFDQNTLTGNVFKNARGERNGF